MSVIKFERPKKIKKPYIIKYGEMVLDELGGLHAEGFRFSDGITDNEARELIIIRLKEITERY